LREQNVSGFAFLVSVVSQNAVLPVAFSTNDGAKSWVARKKSALRFQQRLANASLTLAHEATRKWIGLAIKRASQLGRYSRELGPCECINV
jgi:hypothetical protein